MLLKNLKILTEEANDTDEDDTVIENLDDAISRQIAVMTSMKESFEELREEQDRIDGIQVIGEDDEEEELDADNDDDEDSDFDADEEYDDAHEDSNVNDDVTIIRLRRYCARSGALRRKNRCPNCWPVALLVNAVRRSWRTARPVRSRRLLANRAFPSAVSCRLGNADAPIRPVFAGL